jgi:hypothetical protein
MCGGVSNPLNLSLDKINIKIFVFQHYEKDADGLCTRLCKCLPKVGSQEYCVDVKAFMEAGWIISHKDIEVME